MHCQDHKYTCLFSRATILNTSAPSECFLDFNTKSWGQLSLGRRSGPRVPSKPTLTHLRNATTAQSTAAMPADLGMGRDRR